MTQAAVMDTQAARAAKKEVSAYVRDLVDRRISAQGDGYRVPQISLGLAPQPGGGFQVAVRYRRGVPAARMVARRVIEHAGPAVDVRRTGRIRAADATGHGGTGTGPRPPVITALAAGETGRARPLRPGVSIAHVDVSAGTLGAFVEVDGVLHALSNYHVLVGEPSAAVGDGILQPGPADGGTDPADRVGTLAAFVALSPGETALVDAAVALLDDAEVDATYPVGRVTTTSSATASSWASCGSTTSWGELVALRPRHIDRHARTITVQETIVEVSAKDSPTGQRMLVKPYPKDDESRTLAVSQELLDVLTARIRGLGLEPDDLLFPSRETAGDS